MERIAIHEKANVQNNRMVWIIPAFLLIVGIVYVVGFIGSPAVHDAFHDVRHTAGFPCH